jgi:hypothetical protein
VLLLETVAHSRKLKSSLKNKNQGLELRERGAQIWISRWVFDFISGQQPYGIGERLFIVTTSKRVVGRVFIGLVRWGTGQVR